MAKSVEILRKAGPVFAKQAALWAPQLLDKDLRDGLADAAKGLAARSPGRQLKARIDVTALLAGQMAEKASTADESERAAAWQEQARKLSIRLELPIGSRRARADHRRSVADQLTRLQAEMDRDLTG